MAVPIFDVFELNIIMYDVHTGGGNVGLCPCTNLIYYVWYFGVSIFGDAGEPMVSRTEILK